MSFDLLFGIYGCSALFATAIGVFLRDDNIVASSEISLKMVKYQLQAIDAEYAAAMTAINNELAAAMAAIDNEFAAAITALDAELVAAMTNDNLPQGFQP